MPEPGPGAVASGAVASGAAASAATRRPLRVAVVGLDHFHVTGWVETVEQVPELLRIVALHDPDAERGRVLAPRFTDPSLRRALGDAYRDLPFETDLDALIERHTPDVALVLLPNRDAPAAIARLAEAGIHLLVDKPGARTADELRPAIDAARAAGVRLVTGLTRRYSPAWQEAARIVAAGELGRIVAVEAMFAAADVHVRGLANPLFDPELSGGGILSWLGIHDLDAIRWVTDEPVVELSATTARMGDPGLRVEDVASVTMRLAGGGIATLQQAFVLPARGYRGWFAVRGTTGSLEIGLDETLSELRRDDATGFVSTTRTELSLPPAPGYGGSGLAAVRDLVAAIDDGHEPLASAQDLLGALALVDAAYASAGSGRPVRIEHG